MPCFRPLSAWQTDDGDIVFKERGRIRRSLKLPCGQCVGCRLERSRQWAVRCVHEASLHEANSFITLTYDDAHYTPGLIYDDFQRFLKRARSKLGRFRFYMAGEYGEQLQRPHFHALLFGLGFPDRVKWKKLPSGSWLYRSAVLESLWTDGFSTVGDVTFESAAYVARYVMKKITGPPAEEHYRRVCYATGEEVEVRPEFNRMSLKPGIGRDYIDKWRSDVYPRDFVVINGFPSRPPRYYDLVHSLKFPYQMDDIKFEREKKAALYASDQTPERLRVKEEVAKARLNLKKRTLI